MAAAQKGDVRHVVRRDLLGVRFCNVSDTVGMPNDPNDPYANRLVDRNVFGEDLAMCGIDPVTGFYRDGCCSTGPEDMGSHTLCGVMSKEFLDHQRSIGNDLSTPMPHYRFPGLVPGDRWCVTARNWLRAHHDGAACPVVLDATHERVLDIIPLEILRNYAVDVPPDLGALSD